MSVKIKVNKDTKEKYLETSLWGYSLITNSRWNKGTLFTQEERDIFQLNGLIPQGVSNLNETINKRYLTLIKDKLTPLDKHIYLRALQDRNETLFYALIDKHLEEIMPLIYTPVVGEACQKFSNIYRRARGLFLSYPHKDQIEEILSNPNFDDTEVIVVSDGERILGLGDQGIGGMGIPIGKLSLYTACAGIAPEKCLPILLDVGTNNKDLLDDPNYLGWREHRIKQDEYNEFIDIFVKAVKKRFPNVLLQWEDFAQKNANPLLQKYKDEICSFNDDIQGTAAIVVSALISAIKASEIPLEQHRIAVAGAGSAGVGISNLLVDYMMSQGLSKEQAFDNIYLIDRHGLITEHVECLDFQKNFVKSNQHIEGWLVGDEDHITLLETVSNAKITMLIGTSAQGGLFTEQIITNIALNSRKPIIFPLSNPNTKAEAKPSDIMEWTNSKAIVGTGSPFPLVDINGKHKKIDQVNNCYIFPGIGLGVISVKAKKVTNKMFLEAAVELSKLSPILKNPEDNILPPLKKIKSISRDIALAVAKVAIQENLTDDKFKKLTDDELKEIIEDNMWKPKYLKYVRVYE